MRTTEYTCSCGYHVAVIYCIPEGVMLAPPRCPACDHVLRRGVIKEVRHGRKA